MSATTVQRRHKQTGGVCLVRCGTPPLLGHEGDTEVLGQGRVRAGGASVRIRTGLYICDFCGCAFVPKDEDAQ